MSLHSHGEGKGKSITVRVETTCGERNEGLVVRVFSWLLHVSPRYTVHVLPVYNWVGCFTTITTRILLILILLFSHCDILSLATVHRTLTYTHPRYTQNIRDTKAKASLLLVSSVDRRICIPLLREGVVRGIGGDKQLDKFGIGRNETIGNVFPQQRTCTMDEGAGDTRIAACQVSRCAEIVLQSDITASQLYLSLADSPRTSAASNKRSDIRFHMYVLNINECSRCIYACMLMHIVHTYPHVSPTQYSPSEYWVSIDGPRCSV